MDDNAASLMPPPGEGRRGTEGYLGYLLRQASHAYRQRMEKALADLGVTPPQFTVLTMLGAYPGLSGADLARAAFVTPQTVSVILANLERAGLVGRRAHEVHGRIRPAALTDAGRDLLARARAKAAGPLASASPFTEKVEKGGSTLFRARFAGLEKTQAEAACKNLKRSEIPCLLMKN